MKNIFLKRAFIFLLSMVTLHSALPTLSLPVSAATSWPSLSTSGYCEYVVPGNADVYCDAALKTRGASGKSYNAYIAAGDVIKVYEVTSSYTYLEYPTSSGMKTGYAKTSSLFGVSYPVEKIVSSGKVTTYQTPAESNQSGYVAKNDTVFKLGLVKSGEYTLVMYTAISGSRAYKAAFVKTESYHSTISASGAVVQTQIPESGSYVRIRYSANNRYLDIPAEKISENGAQLQLWDYTKGNKNQIYQLVDTGNGWQIISRQSGKIVEVRDSSHDDFAQVAQWDMHSLDCGRWDIVRNNDGTVSFRNRESGKYLNVQGGGDAGNGTKIIQYYDDGTAAMRFYLETADKDEANNSSGGAEFGNTASAVQSRLDDIASGKVKYNSNTVLQEGKTFTGTRDNEQCKGYAKNVFSLCFGTVPGSTRDYPNNYLLSSTDGMALTGSVTKMTTGNISNLFKQGKPGDFVQMRRTHGGSHSAILYDVSNDGVTFMEANTDGKNTISRKTYTWDQLCSKNAAMSVYTATNYVLH